MGHAREGTETRIPSAVAELAFDAQQAVVLGHALASGDGAGLDLAGAIATARSAMVVSSVSPDRCETTADQPAPRASSMASRVSVSVPIWLSLMRTELAAPSSMPAGDPFRVGDEQVVADELDRVAEPLGEVLPAVPVVLGQAVLDRHDRIARSPVGPQVDELPGVQRPTFAART